METKLKPKDIRTKEFGRKLFGYNPDEVDAFLIEVSNEFQNLLKTIENLKKSKAEEKVEFILKEAKKKVEEIIQKSKEEKEELNKEKEKIENEIEKLKQVQRKLMEKLKLTMMEMTKIIEELKESESSKDRGKSHSKVIKELN